MTWFLEAPRRVHLDFHTPKTPYPVGEKFDANAFADTIAAAHVTEVTCFAKCAYGYAYHDTAIGNRHPNLAKDLLAEQIQALHDRGIRVMAHYSVSLDEVAFLSRPTWRQRDREGNDSKTINSHGKPDYWGYLCVNSPYREEKVLPEIDELAAGWEIDGVFLDVVTFPPGMCLCHFCKRKFQLLHGLELTPSLAASEASLFNEFQMQSRRSFLQDVRNSLKAHRPEAIMCANSHGGHVGSDRRILDFVDYAIVESRPGSFGRSYSDQGFHSRYARNLHKPFQIMNTRFVSSWADFTVKRAEELKFEYATILANGGQVSSGDHMYPEGNLEPAAWNVLGEAFGWAEPRQRWWAESKSVRHIAVLASIPHDQLKSPETSESPRDVTPERVLTAYDQMLLERHKQFDLIDETCLLDSLQDFQILVLPENAVVSDPVEECIREWVRGGGQLIGVGLGFPDGDGGHRLEDVLGLDFADAAPYSVFYYRLGQRIAGTYGDTPLVVSQPVAKARSTTAESLADAWFPLLERSSDRFFSHVSAPPYQKSPYPGISLNSFGAGRAAFIATNVGQEYLLKNHVWMRDILGNTVDLFDDAPPWKVEASPSLEGSLMRSDSDLLLHLTFFHAERSTMGGVEGGVAGHAPTEWIPPVRNIAVMIKAPAAESVMWEPDGEELPFEQCGEYVRVELPELKIHGILRVRGY